MVSRIRRRSVGVVIRCLAREAAEDDGELIPPRQARYDRGHTRSPATDASWYRSHFGIDDNADRIAPGGPCPNGIGMPYPSTACMPTRRQARWCDPTTRPGDR
jgi:hypothetical protein